MLAEAESKVGCFVGVAALFALQCCLPRKGLSYWECKLYFTRTYTKHTHAHTQDVDLFTTLVSTSFVMPAVKALTQATHTIALKLLSHILANPEIKVRGVCVLTEGVV